ncbi:uncharacterized protein LOC108678374, partial [Hyalella azteca]|uniref:Uncharacterized protein LOC108678374 n=1 Tax=Hyalella azteca TaxID=294128 RepID=A0A8B7P8Y0_HYAAZ
MFNISRSRSTFNTLATVECIDSAKSPDQFTDLAPAPVELMQEKLVGIGVPREKTSNSVISDPVLQSSNEHVTAGEDSHKKNMATKNVAEPSDSDKTSSQKYQGVEKESLEVRNDENKLKENEGQSKNRNAEKDVKQDGEYQSHKSMYRHSKEDGKKYEEVGRKTGSEKTEKERQIKFDRVDNRKSEEGGRRKPIEKGMKKLDEVDHKKSGELVCKKTDVKRCTKSEDGRRHGNSDEKSRTKPYERGQKNRDERRNKNHDERGHKNNDERSKAKLPSQEKTLENLDKPDKKARDTVSDTIASGKMVLGRKEPTDDLSDDKNENGKNLLRSERVRSKSRSNSQGENRLSTRMDRKPRDAWNRRLPERRKRSSEVDSPASENRMRLHSRSPRRSGHFPSDRNRRSPPFRHRSSDSHILKRECNSPENSRLHDRRINNPEAPYHESKIYPRNLGTRPPDCRDGLFSRTFAAGNEHRFSSVHSLPNSGIPPLFPRNTSIHHEHGIHGHMSPPWVPSRGNTRSPDRYFSQSERHRSPLRRTPDRLRRTPDRFRRMPGSLRRTPDQFGRTPDQLRRTPDQFRRTPDQFRRTPDQFRRTP